MKKWKKITAALAGLVIGCSFSLFAAEQATDYQQVKSKLQNALKMQISAIGDSPVPGLLQIMAERGLFYTSLDGKYLLQARVYNIDEDMRNETEEALGSVRLDGLKAFQNDYIEYKAKNEKFVVNVFTDISCGYCRKLHNEMAQYNDLGITVRYLAFPRAGLNSRSYNDMVSVWCADNQQKAMDDAKAGDSVASKSCDTKIAQQYAFGQSVGVNGTPNIILPDGSVIPGYQPPKQLEQALKALL